MFCGGFAISVWRRLRRLSTVDSGNVRWWLMSIFNSSRVLPSRARESSGNAKKEEEEEEEGDGGGKDDNDDGDDGSTSL
ncbi:hypothetical protein PV328_004571, partial [Microctonus aethiopoides]